MAEHLSLMGIDSLAANETLKDSVMLMFYYLQKDKKDKFLKLWNALLPSLSEDEKLFLIGEYTNYVYEAGIRNVPSEIMRPLNEMLRRYPSFFAYQTKFFLKLAENKHEDAREILQTMKKKYKNRKKEIKELEAFL